MLEYLDIRTLAAVCFLHTFLLSGCLYVVGAKRWSYPGLQLFAGSLFAIGFGLLCITAHNLLPSFIAIIVSNVLVFVGFTLMNYALRCLNGLALRHIESVVLVHLFYIFLLVFTTYIHPSITLRIILINTFLPLQYIFCAYHFFHRKSARHTTIEILISLLFISAATLFVVRGLVAFTQVEFTSFLDNAAGFDRFTFLSINLLMLIGTFGFLWIIRNKYEDFFYDQERFDKLTKTYNRKAMHDLSNLEIKRAQRHNTALSLILVDIDHFRAINDNFGPLDGDNVLKELSTLLMSQVRQHDLIFRYGGEEFLILLPETTLPEALIVAEKLRKTVEETPLGNKISYHITASFGATQMRNEENWEVLVHRTEIALYQAKNMGRNCVVQG